MIIKGFQDAFSALMGNEGKFTCNAKDPGNWTGGKVGSGTLNGTMWGVSCATAARHGYTGSMKYLPLETAELIAKKEYWDPHHLDSINPELAFQVFDTIYNGGKAIVWLQRASGAVEDGVMGPNTIRIVNSCDYKSLIMKFDAYRIQYLASLETWPDFGKGWMNRIANNLIEGAN